MATSGRKKEPKEKPAPKRCACGQLGILVQVRGKKNGILSRS